jgi:hypothetical protein
MLGIVEGSMVSTPVGGVKMDVGPLREAALAPGRLAAAIGQDVGGLFDDVSDKIQNARNTRKVFDADLKMRATKDQFLTDIQKDPNLAKDPGTWVPAYQERVKATQDSILNDSGLGPAVKRHLSMMSDSWALDSVSDIRGAALLRETADTKAAGVASANAALSAGDLDAGTAAYKALNEAGIMGPKETAQLIKQAPIVVAESKANVAISSNPIAAPKIIEEQLKKDLPPLKYRVILNVAKEQQAKAQAANAQDLAGRIDDSPDHTIDENLLKAWKDSGKIRTTDYERIVNRQKAYAKADEKERHGVERDDFNVAMMEADTPPTDGTKIQDWAAEQKSKGLEWTNPAYRRRFNEFVDRKVDGVMKKGESEERPVEKQTFDAMREDREKSGSFIPLITSTQKAPWYEFWKGSTSTTDAFDGSLTAFRKQLSGMSADDIKAAFGPDATAKKVIDAEQLQYATKTAKMRDWFKANPEATVEQADEYRMSLEAPDAMEAVKQSIVAGPTIDTKAEPNTSKEDYDKLKPGQPFWWNGKQINKK